ADTVRDPRGFAVKFYTEEGIYDLAGNDLPVFFIRDAVKFPDVIHSLKPDPATNMVNPVRFWDFVSLSPEATHMVTWLYSDRGTIKSYRHVEGFGVNTFTWINAAGEIFYIKYHWKTRQGVQTIGRDEAHALAGTQPDIAVADLRDAITRGDFPQWELNVQIMRPGMAEGLPFDVLDDTKTWPEDLFPLQPIGRMTLNRNPENFFAQVEQAAFCPGNVVPGIGFSADKMLQGRTFSYLDAQRYRVGPNFAQLPVNRSKSPVANNQRDGAMTYEINPEPVNYFPNSLNDNQPSPDPAFYMEGMPASGRAVRQAIEKTDDFTQAGERWRSLSPEERAALHGNIAAELKTAPADIRQRVLGYFAQADEGFAAGVKGEMGM
ncbi:MAG: catalase, partial [Firmicutes bacterium]|nr:catalase [Bacillota bacterium]